MREKRMTKRGKAEGTVREGIVVQGKGERRETKRIYKRKKMQYIKKEEEKGKREEEEERKREEKEKEN